MSEQDTYIAAWRRIAGNDDGPPTVTIDRLALLSLLDRIETNQQPATEPDFDSMGLLTAPSESFPMLSVVVDFNDLIETMGVPGAYDVVSTLKDLLT